MKNSSETHSWVGDIKEKKGEKSVSKKIRVKIGQAGEVCESDTCRIFGNYLHEDEGEVAWDEGKYK